MATALERTSILKLITTMFNAAPGASYLAEFVTFFDTVATGTSDQRLITLAESLGRNPVYQNINPSFQVGNDFATSVLTPFGLQANAEAIAFVNKGLTDGLSKGRIALNVMNAINNNTSPSPDLIAAKQMLDNKATVAEYYSVTKLASNANLVNLQAVLSGVTASTGSVITANASVDALTAPASQLFTLTTGADTRTGGAANDNFDGSLSGTNMTLNNFDVLDGAGGIDTLSAVINAGSTFSPTLRNIENVSMQFTGAGTLSLANATGVTSVENSNSSATAVFSNISSTAIALRNVGTGSDVTYGYTAAAVAGTADTATLTLSNTTGGAVAMTGVETVNIVSADGANSIIATNIAATTLNVSGTQTTALGTLNATVATLNAGAATNTFSATMGAVAAATVTGGQGNDSINVSAVSGTVNVNTGAGNDTVTATSNLLASDTLNGGDGTDILVAAMGSVDTTATATAFTNISNFETLQISDALANTLTTARVQAGFNQVTLASGGTGTINLEAGARTVRVSAALTGGLTVNDTGIATNDTLSITNGAAATNVGNGQALTIGGFETTTITTTGSGAAAAQTLGTIGITPDAGGSATLNLAGSNSITIGAVTATSASFLTIDASGLTGTAAATIAAPVRVTITTGATNIIGSANADTITASNNNTTIDGGAGNDTITAGTGVDSIAGGLGDDTFTFAGNLTASDSINGGAGNDILSITATSTDVDYTNISAVEVLNVAGTISATLGALAATAGINRVQYGAVGTVETVTVGAGFTNDLTVVQAATGTPDNDVVNASAYTRNLTIQTANTNGLATGSTFTGGTGTADRIVYDLTANAITQANTAGITAIERMTTTGSGANALTVTLNNANVASNATLTIDGSGMNAGGVLTVDASAEQDGRVVVIGGSSADAITGSASSFGDNLSGGDGNDTFTMGANLTSTDTISGGNGTDTVTVSAATVDSAFTNITSVETVTATAALTLGALANAAGVTRVTGSATTTVGSGFTAALSVTLANAGVASVVATNSTTASSSYAGALTVTTSNTGTGITSTDTITGGSGTSDRLVFNATGGAVTEASADLAAVTNIETFAVTGSTVNNVSITLNDANIAAARSLTIDGSNLTTGVLTVVGSNETNGSLIVLGGAANDAITGSTSTLGDSLSGGAGDDTFTFTSASLTAADTISGGTGNDTLTFSDASTVTDASFTNITSVENLTNGLLNANQTITLGALANASGLTTITGNGTGADVVTVGAGFTNALRINLVTGNDNIAASATAAAINVRANAAAVDANDTLQGGTGTGDVLTLTADNGTATTTLMTGFETITVAANGTSTIAITMGANNTQIAAGRTLTVNATALTDAAASLAFTGTASETDGSLSVTGGNGADTIIGGGFTDTLIGGIGNDRLTGGLSADVLTGGAGADTFVYTSASVADSSGAAFDTITDWTSGTDKLEITLNYSTSVSSVIVDANRSSAGVAGVSAAQDTLSGARGQYVYDTTNSVLLVNVNNDNLITTSDFRIGLNAASTASATVVNGDINFVIIGGSAADTITAGNGADTISGGAGADVLNYNTGNAPAGELINGGADTDTLVVVTSTDFTAATFGTTGTNTVLTQGGIEQVVITAGQTGTFLGTQLTGQAININGSTTAASTLTITGANATGDFSGLTFAAGGGFAFVSGTAVVNINVGSVTAAITTGTTLADNITGTALNDTIIGGAGADVITLGTGTDTTVFAAASLTGIAAGAATTALADRITGATFGAIAGGGDVFNISITNGQTGLAIADANNGLVVAGAATVEVIAAATATTLGATTNVIAMTTTYADSTALLAAIGTGNARLTEASTLTANRDLVIVWSNGTDSYIGLLNDSNGDGAAVMATADLTFSLLGTLVGVASAATAVNANFAFIA